MILFIQIRLSSKIQIFKVTRKLFIKIKEVQEHNTDTAGAGEKVLDVGTVNRESTPVTK